MHLPEKHLRSHVWRSPASLRATATAWHVSLVAGSAGALASVGWFTAFAPAANVRTLGMVEVVFSYLVSHKLAARAPGPGREGWPAAGAAGRGRARIFIAAGRH
jgi:hypothetical protein